MVLAGNIQLTRGGGGSTDDEVQTGDNRSPIAVVFQVHTIDVIEATQFIYLLWGSDPVIGISHIEKIGVQEVGQSLTAGFQRKVIVYLITQVGPGDFCIEVLSAFAQKLRGGR